MEPLALLQELVMDHTVQTVALGSALLGLCSGALGSFAVLRKQSLLGDAIAHAALPGVALAFLFTLSKEPIVLLLGALATGILGTLAVMAITRNTMIKEDAALGIILSVFFGLGIVLLTAIAKLPTAQQAGLSKFLFGSASTLLTDDIIVMSVLGIVCIIGLILFWKEFKLLAFDREFGESLGFSMKTADILLTMLIVVAIVIGLQTVGVVLMSAIIIAPGVAARQWTNKLGLLVLLASLFGAIAGVSGAVISSLVPKLPTGPTIVVIMSSIVVVSLFLAPNRGILWEQLRYFFNRKEMMVIRLMTRLCHLSQSHPDIYHPHPHAALQAMMPGDCASTLQILYKRGFVKKVMVEQRAHWALTPQGFQEAQQLAERYGNNIP